jgi:hypothetical protein
VVTESPIPREQRPVVANFLAQRLVGPVSIETWTQQESALVRTDRDPCTFCEQVATAARQLASLHSMLSLTRYDLDRHADRAREAGIDRPPVTVVRGGSGRGFRVVGMWSGLLFPAFVDGITFAAAGVAPIQEPTRSVLQAIDAELEQDLAVELLIAPYDPYSAHTLRILAAFAVESRRLRFEAIEVSEFPRLAAARMLSEVPVLTIDGRRFPGAWEEAELAEQLRRHVAGDTEPVIRDQVLTSPFMTVDQAQQLAAQEGGQAQGLPAGPPQPPTTPGGLVLPS